MLRILGQFVYWIGGGALGLVIQRQQAGLTKPLKRYRQRRRDTLVPITLDAKMNEWLAGIDMPTAAGQYLLTISPTAFPPLTREVLRVTGEPPWATLMMSRLHTIESDVVHLVDLMNAEEQGKLRANLDYVTDFAGGLTYTLVLMYAGQVDYVRFGTVLEEIDLQSAQLLGAIQIRHADLAERCLVQLKASGGHPSTKTTGLVDQYFDVLRKWYLGVHVRCIAGYLRASLPRANKNFVYRQLSRLRTEHRRELRREQQVLRMLNSVVSHTSSERSTIDAVRGWLLAMRLETQKNLDEVVDVVAAKTEFRELSRLTERLLRRPARISRELSRHLESSYSLVVEFDGDHQIVGAWKVDRGESPKHDPKQDAESQRDFDASSLSLPAFDQTPSSCESISDDPVADEDYPDDRKRCSERLPRAPASR